MRLTAVMSLLALFGWLVACTHDETPHARYVREQREAAEMVLRICKERSHSDAELCEIDHAFAAIEQQRGRATAGIRGHAATWMIARLENRRRERTSEIAARQAMVKARARVKCPPDQPLC